LPGLGGGAGGYTAGRDAEGKIVSHIVSENLPHMKILKGPVLGCSPLLSVTVMKAKVQEDATVQ
jgi:hypothetical protein